MGLLRVIVILLAVSFILGAVKAFLNRRGIQHKIMGNKKKPDFIAEELYKLHELKNRGILSEEEYRKQKDKLLQK